MPCSSQRSTFPAARSFAESAPRSRCRCSTRWCRRCTLLAQTAANPQQRLGFVYFPNGAVMDQWIPAQSGSNIQLSPILKCLEPYQEPGGRGRQPRPRRHDDRRPRRGGRRLADGRLREADRGAGRARRRHDRPDRREADRPGHAVPVARSRDRGLHGLRRRLHAGLQLRLHEHDLLGDADHAAADGDQPARRVRADVRPAGHGRAAASAHAAEPEHPRLDRGRCERRCSGTSARATARG